MHDNSLVNLGELSRPATILVEKIAEALGGVFKPFQMVRTAKAEAEVRRIEAESQIQVTDLERRAMQRFLREEARSQANMEGIAASALTLLREDSSPDKVDTDWIANFFEKCRIVSDFEMQQLWSRLLAEEANQPGAISKKTVNLLADLDKSDAELFVKLCGFVWTIREPVPLVFDHDSPTYVAHGIQFSTLAHLESLGLVMFEPSAGYSLTELPKSITAKYHGKELKLVLPNDERNWLPVGGIVFSRAGQQIAKVCGSTPVEGFFEFVRDEWSGRGLLRDPTGEAAAQD